MMMGLGKRIIADRGKYILLTFPRHDNNFTGNVVIGPGGSHAAYRQEFQVHFKAESLQNQNLRWNNIFKMGRKEISNIAYMNTNWRVIF